MPNLLAHSLVAKRFIITEDEISPDKSSFIHGNGDYISLGTQGPDPLFYMGIVPFHALHVPTALKKIGNRIHETDAKKYFSLLIKQSYTIEDYAERSRFQSFILGQFAHYLLDRETHPYVIYESGFDEDGKLTGKYHYRHAHFEAEIDVSLARKNKMNYFLTNPEDVLNTNDERLKLIDRNFVPVLSEMFSEKLPKKMYSNAVRNMKATIKFMNRHPGFKSRLAGKTSLGAMALPLKEEMGDVLNETRADWKDPVSGRVRNDSFGDLYNNAFRLLENCYHDIMKHGFHYEVLKRYINGLDYYGSPLRGKWTHSLEREAKD